MAAADPPNSNDGSSKLFPNSLFEEVTKQDSQVSGQDSAPLFDPPSHRRPSTPPMPVARSARIIPSANPNTEEVDRFDRVNIERQRIPNDPPNQRPFPDARAAGNQTAPAADRPGILRTANDGPTVRETPRSHTPVARPGQRAHSDDRSTPSAPSPHLSAVPSAESIATKCCADGHPNNPDVSVCRICGVAFRPTTQIVQMTPGAIFRLIFEDGTAIEIADDIIVGRSPVNDEVIDTLTVDDPQVSRQHFVLEARGWQLAIKDCKSMNGTFLSRRGKRGRVRVSTETGIPVQAGDTVHFGSRQALIVDIGPN